MKALGYEKSFFDSLGLGGAKRLNLFLFLLIPVYFINQSHNSKQLFLQLIKKRVGGLLFSLSSVKRRHFILFLLKVGVPKITYYITLLIRKFKNIESL